MSWWLRTPRDLQHLGRELRGRDHAALDERLGERRNPLLVVGGAVVGFGRQRLDVLAQLVDGHEALLAALVARDSHAQHHEGIDPPLPVGAPPRRSQSSYSCSTGSTLPAGSPPMSWCSRTIGLSFMPPIPTPALLLHAAAGTRYRPASGRHGQGPASAPARARAERKPSSS